MRSTELFTLLGIRDVSAGRDSSVGIANPTGWTVRGSNPGGGEIFHTHPDQPGAHPASYKTGTELSPGGEATGR